MRLASPGMLAALAQGATIVTPNAVLASIALEQFNREQLTQGRSSWERPAIYSHNTWMANCWQDARFALPKAPLMLSPIQERELWRQTIEADRPDLFDLRAMAAMAQRAYRTLAEFEISVDGESWAEHADAAEFLRWRRTLQSRLKDENWITRSDLWRLLPSWIKQRVIEPGAVAFVALTTVSAGIASLSRALGDSVQNIGIVYLKQPGIVSALQFESVSQEMQHVARSVRHLLESDKVKSIGILVADLPTHVKELTRVLQEVLYPSGSAEEHVHVQGKAWIEHPLIANALLILQLAQARVGQASTGAILRSPFIDGACKERSERAFADVRLRRARELDFSPAELVKAAWDCPILFQVLSRILKTTHKLSPVMRLSAWSSAFSEMLEAARWPAIDQVTEAEQQAIDQWNAALSDLASLGLVSPLVTLDQALGHLQAILATPSATGSWSSPVQIIDTGSSEGMEFDHSFVLNMCESAWPVTVSLSPLIPYHLQRAHHVPFSQPDLMAEERARKTDGLFTSGSHVQVSFTGRLAPSLRHRTQVSIPNESVLWLGAIASESYRAVQLDSEDDSQAPPIQPSEEVRGGASVLKAQSLCPFKAFAEYRLDAKGDDDASIGFDALERGECAHRALEYVWGELGTQQRLKALSDNALVALVEKHVANAVEQEESGGPIRDLTSLAERDRLREVILQWLQIEKDRSVPFTVETIEEKREVELSGLKLKLRMDRVDRLADGSLLLIDYKSGAQQANKLKGDRPREPQLLVYAAAINERISGVYFGELRNRRVRPVGHGLNKDFPKARGTEAHGAGWDYFLQNSRSAVHQLAQEFREGQAAVTPQFGACSYCRIKPICRIGAAAADTEDIEE